MKLRDVVGGAWVGMVLSLCGVWPSEWLWWLIAVPSIALGLYVGRSSGCDFN